MMMMMMMMMMILNRLMLQSCQLCNVAQFFLHTCYTCRDIFVRLKATWLVLHARCHYNIMECEINLVIIMIADSAYIYINDPCIFIPVRS
jgi:hypothetical protein